MDTKHFVHTVMKKGDTVHWNWGAHEAEGKIIKGHTQTTEKTIKGAKVKRNANKDEPAFEIKQASGATVLKSESELKKGKSRRNGKDPRHAGIFEAGGKADEAGIAESCPEIRARRRKRR